MDWRFIFFVAVFVAGCTQQRTVKEQEHPSYVLGRKLVASGEKEKALEEFSKVIQAVPSAKNAYLEMGQIYLSSYDDPIYAIYYFRQFLEQNHDKRNEPIVNELIETAKKRFVQQTIGNNKELFYSSQQNFLSLLRHLREENDSLRAQIMQITKQRS